MNIRGHHLLCLPRVKGGGYSKKFSENFFRIQKRIRKNPDAEIKIVRSCDEICHVCPFEKKNKCAKEKSSNYWVRVQDNKVIKKLKIKENEKWKAGDIFNLSFKKIKDRELRDICRGCQFLKSCLKHGPNRSFIKDLKVGDNEKTGQ